jgi:excisionase family DNA binding protein
MPTDEGRWLSVNEIAEYVGVSQDSVYTWATSKRMPGHKVGRFWKFEKTEIDDRVHTGGAASSNATSGGKRR